VRKSQLIAQRAAPGQHIPLQAGGDPVMTIGGLEERAEVIQLAGDNLGDRR
jgi:hypothetical protein